MFRLIVSDKPGAVVLLLLAIAAVAVPVCNLVIPEGNILHVSTYSMTLWGKYLCYALLAVSVDLV